MHRQVAMTIIALFVDSKKKIGCYEVHLVSGYVTL